MCITFYLVSRWFIIFFQFTSTGEVISNRREVGRLKKKKMRLIDILELQTLWTFSNFSMTEEYLNCCIRGTYIMVASFLNPIKISVFVIAGKEGLVACHLFVKFAA